PVALLSLAVLAPIMLAGCTSKESENGAIAVTSTNDGCDLDKSEAQTGDVNFKVTNNGSKVTEFYLYGNNNRV
ncbi:peptidase M75 family protein, partial [Streptomyces sp. SID10244]|nr:peptidase M75 family protein [Streptomyces sp. SID10244]